MPDLPAAGVARVGDSAPLWTGHGVEIARGDYGYIVRRGARVSYHGRLEQAVEYAARRISDAEGATLAKWLVTFRAQSFSLSGWTSMVRPVSSETR